MRITSRHSLHIHSHALPFVKCVFASLNHPCVLHIFISQSAIESWGVSTVLTVTCVPDPIEFSFLKSQPRVSKVNLAALIGFSATGIELEPGRHQRACHALLVLLFKGVSESNDFGQSFQKLRRESTGTPRP